jgi:hypothetical protein
VLQHQILVDFDDVVGAFDEGRQEPQVLDLGPFFLGLLDEHLHEGGDGLFGDGLPNGDAIILEDADQALLDAGLVNLVRVLHNPLHPPRDIDSVLGVIHHDFLQQLVAVLEDLDQLRVLRAVVCRRLRSEQVSRVVSHKVQCLERQLSQPRLNHYPLDILVR